MFDFQTIKPILLSVFNCCYYFSCDHKTLAKMAQVIEPHVVRTSSTHKTKTL